MKGEEGWKSHLLSAGGCPANTRKPLYQANASLLNSSNLPSSSSASQPGTTAKPTTSANRLSTTPKTIKKTVTFKDL
jgi:hypothetical protein